MGICASSSRVTEGKITVYKFEPTHKIVHFVRHAEGEHNAANKKDPIGGYLREDLEDAFITELGRSQCHTLRDAAVNHVKDAELLVVSPMHRALQTATESFPQLIGKIPWVAIECIRERTGDHPCDRRRPISEHKAAYEHVDFSLIEEEHDPLFHKCEGKKEPSEQVVTRCRDFVRWLEQREERHIIMVGHSAYIKHLFDNVLVFHDGSHNPKLKNCEMKSVVLPLQTTSEDLNPGVDSD